MHNITEALKIYDEELLKNPKFNEELVFEWKEQMPDEFIRKMFQKKYGYHIRDKETYNDAVQLLIWVDNRGESAKWGLDDIKSLSGIDFDKKEYSLFDFAYIVNMLYSDYCNVFTDSSNYVKMAKNYLEDPDFMGNASERAYHDAIKRIRYFE